MRQRDSELNSVWGTCTPTNLSLLMAKGTKQGLSRQDRYDTLHRIAQEQLSLLDRSNAEHKFRKLLPGTENPQLSEK